MGTDDIIVTGARLAGQMTGDPNIANVANIAGEVVWRFFNPASAFSGLVTDGIKALILKDGMDSGSPIGNDIDLYQAGTNGADLNLVTISIPLEDLAIRAISRFVPAIFLLTDAQKVLEARGRVHDHKDMIQGMAERGIPGFAHEIMVKESGEVVEVFAQVPLDGGQAVTYVHHYDGEPPDNALVMDGNRVMRDTLEGRARDELTNWAEHTEGEAHLQLLMDIEDGQDASMSEADRALAVNAAVGITYQQLKGSAIADMTREMDREAQPHMVENVTGSDSPESILPPGFGAPTPGA